MGTAGAAVTGVAVSSDSESVVIGAQIVASAAGSCAVMPQVIENVRRGSSGEFSPVTASLLTLGNALRLWTTRELTGDPLLTAGFTVGLAANGVLYEAGIVAVQQGVGGVDMVTSTPPADVLNAAAAFQALADQYVS
ncbi:MAG: PQ-loop repeat-containing protein, partial [Promethearchaeia archaeon]